MAGLSYSSAPMITALRITASRPMRHRSPTTLFSITAPASIWQPSEIRLLLIVAPAMRDGGKKRARV